LRVLQANYCQIEPERKRGRSLPIFSLARGGKAEAVGGGKTLAASNWEDTTWLLGKKRLGGFEGAGNMRGDFSFQSFSTCEKKVSQAK